MIITMIIMIIMTVTRQWCLPDKPDLLKGISTSLADHFYVSEETNNGGKFGEV